MSHMTFDLSNNIADIALITFAVGAIALIILIVLVARMQSKINRLLGGAATAKSIEGALAHMTGNIKDLEKFRVDLEKYMTTVENRLKKSIQSVETIRFNPFKGTGSGGNQSFATAFINESGNGVVLSSLYSREHVSIFSKPIKAGKPEFELSEEEANALKEAQAKISK
jgi:hypothetical protein